MDTQEALRIATLWRLKQQIDADPKEVVEAMRQDIDRLERENTRLNTELREYKAAYDQMHQEALRRGLRQTLREHDSGSIK